MSQDYFKKLNNKINKYKAKYGNDQKKVAIRMAWWSLIYFIKGQEVKTIDHSQESQKFLRIGIAEGGGFGDNLFQLTYIKEIRKMFDMPVIIDFYCLSYTAFQNFPFIDNCYEYPSSHHKMDLYDVYIISRRFYTIHKFNEEKTKFFSKEFYDFCKDCKNLTDRVFLLGGTDNLFEQYALLFNKNRLEHPNVHGLLPITRYTPKYCQWDEKNFNILNQLKIENVRYITICRAVNSKHKNSNPKLWPLHYYNQLIYKIKKHYPYIKIVQVGLSDKFGLMEGVDICLVGKTSLDQIKVILKYSLLHIDGEGGLVHLKNFLNGRSLVLFGPTNPEVFGYEENINLRSSVCKRCCEWVTRDWFNACLRDLDAQYPLCMKALTPDIVFDSFNEYMKSLPHYDYHVFPIKKDQIEKKMACTGKKIAQICRANNIVENVNLDKNDLYVFDMSLSVKNDLYEKNCAYIKEAKMAGFNVEFATPYNIPVKNETFDMVFCDNLQNVLFQEYCVYEMLRILKDTGLLLLSIKSTKEREMISALFGKTLNPDVVFVAIEKNSGR
ncbi:MAG: hypothetical protein LBQ04_02910 [Endomicrobium sp.]|jgi:ADP-heptose:LPS heptosyltransferase|nr:hypothetical protein [Endomicrobium sp.]